VGVQAAKVLSMKGAVANGRPQSADLPPSAQSIASHLKGGPIEVERVLIVDDHPLVRDGLRTVVAVSFDNCELFEAASIDDTIQVIDREGDFDLVLLDLNMPGAEGYSGLDSLRTRFPSIPIVIVSGSVDRGVVSQALAHGAAGFIPKSLKRAAIVDAIKQVMAGEIYTPEAFSDEAHADPEDEDIMRRIDSLTPQQKVVLQLLVSGLLNKQIAYELNVSMTTVKAHVSAILAKMRVFSRTQAVILANRVNFGTTARSH